LTRKTHTRDEIDLQEKSMGNEPIGGLATPLGGAFVNLVHFLASHLAGAGPNSGDAMTLYGLSLEPIRKSF
jgi:hypothetical protein